MSGSPPERQPKRQWRVEDRPSPFPRHSVPAVAVRLAQPDRGEWDDEGGLQALREEQASLHSLTGGSGMMRGGLQALREEQAALHSLTGGRGMRGGASGSEGGAGRLAQPGSERIRESTLNP